MLSRDEPYRTWLHLNHRATTRTAPVKSENMTLPRICQLSYDRNKEASRAHLGPKQRDEERETWIDPRPCRRVAYDASGSVTGETPILYLIFAEAWPFYH